jgi:hypothetical protein
MTALVDLTLMWMMMIMTVLTPMTSTTAMAEQLTAATTTTTTTTTAATDPFNNYNFSSEEEIPDEQRLLVKLLANYNSNVRPVMNSNDSVPVTFGISLIQVMDMVSLTMEYFFILLVVLLVVVVTSCLDIDANVKGAGLQYSIIMNIRNCV